MLRKKDMKLTKHDKPYLALEFSDRTGKIEGRLWDKAEQFVKSAETGDIVRIIGSVKAYLDEKQINVDSMEKAKEGVFNKEDMVRVAENREEIFGKVTSYLKSIKNKWMVLLVSEFTSDEQLMMAFKDGLGGKSWHNAYIGGLLEHTYDVMFIVDAMCVLYPEADRDIAVFGAFMHDIGKVFELDPKKMEYTIEGGLVGHIAIGHKLLAEKMKDIPGFPRDLSLRLEHIMLSHHGEYEQQSPVLPKTLEAIIVYQTDELVSQANAIKEIQTAQSDGGRVWSNFVSIKNRKFYIKDAAGEEWAREE